MSNPYLPRWEYIPDGEPRVFGDRVYIYGSHDIAGNDEFCDYKLKCWSASVDDPDNWVCHGDIFHTKDDKDHKSDIDWGSDKPKLFAPDVVYKDGKYYLYAYIENTLGCVAVSERPEGPFKLLSKYKYTMPGYLCNDGIFIDPGVLVDDDGRSYIYCGFEYSFGAELLDNMYEVKADSEVPDIIPKELNDDAISRGFDEKDKLFFEACSPRKVNGTYYLIYSPQKCTCLAYAVSKSPLGPYTFGGYIVDSGVDYPGGNDHGSVCKVKDQWYIFYHRMTNNTIMSRRGCVEKISFEPDGTINQVEATCLGFKESLNPYQITDADLACILKGGAFITERNIFERIITGITSGDVIGYKYFDFGEDFSSKTMEFACQVLCYGTNCTVDILIDGEDGTKIGSFKVDSDSRIIKTDVTAVTGRHSVYFKVSTDHTGWMADYFKGRPIFELSKFVFMK